MTEAEVVLMDDDKTKWSALITTFCSRDKVSISSVLKYVSLHYLYYFDGTRQQAKGRGEVRVKAKH